MLILIACSALPLQAVQTSRSRAAVSPTELPIVIYVIRERWHTAVGFPTADLEGPLATLESTLPHERYLLFGFGDRHYLIGRGPESSELLAALWPGKGLLMVNGLEACRNSPTLPS